MQYGTVIKMVFPAPAQAVYEELVNLGRHTLWNSGLISISHTGPMAEGLQYQTVSAVLGRKNQATIEVCRLVPNKEIEIKSSTGMIAFTASYKLLPGDNQTEVICAIDFDLTGVALNFARPAIESMAKARIKGDLETLRAIIQAQPNGQVQS